MKDEKGNILQGITGKPGVRGRKTDGTYIGGDFIRMMPGSQFPPHTHGGDHEIYFIQGDGYVHINGENILVTEGVLIHIPAEYSHAVSVPATFSAPLFFVAVGHPHQHIASSRRMRTIT